MVSARSSSRTPAIGGFPSAFTKQRPPELGMGHDAVRQMRTGQNTDPIAYGTVYFKTQPQHWMGD